MPTATKNRVSVMPFVVEADHPRNCDLFIQVIGERLRSKIKPVVEVFTKEDGEQTTRPTGANIINNLPANLPGHELSIDPGNLTWGIRDPITKEQLEKVRRAMNETAGMSIRNELRAVKPRTGKLDVHQMKTLVREIAHLLEEGDVKMVKGPKLNMDDVDDLPGKYLYNSRNLSNWRQPTFEEDVPEWIEQLNRLD